MKYSLKLKAIKLRNKGFSYSEILSKVPVARSSLSLWLRSVGLSKKQKQRLTLKKLQAIYRGAKIKRNKRLLKTRQIKEMARTEIGKISIRDLWLIGISLYWAEGSKEKDDKPGIGAIFSNSDPFMIKIFIKWLQDILKISNESIIFEIYIHETYRVRSKVVREYWSSVTGFSISKFDRIYFKQDKINSSRHNKSNSYHGLLRIRVRKSSDLNRKISGWIEGIYSHCGVV